MVEAEVRRSISVHGALARRLVQQTVCARNGSRTSTNQGFDCLFGSGVRSTPLCAAVVISDSRNSAS